jgi:hypothetical protein
MASSTVIQNAPASRKQWTRPELTRMGTVADVAAANPNKASSNIQGNFT